MEMDAMMNGEFTDMNEERVTGRAATPVQDAVDRRAAPGLGSWRPRPCRRFASAPWLLAVLSAYVFFQSMAVNGLVDGSLASLQRRFELSSFKAGLLPSIYDVFASVLIVAVGYAGNTANKPRLLAAGGVFIALGGLVFALPHFTTGPYVAVNAAADDGGRNSSGVCTGRDAVESASASAEDQETPDASIASLSGYLYVFILSNALFAVGSCTVYSLGYAFLDESVPTKNAGLYIGILSVFSLLGPAIGLVIAGGLLSLHTDFYLVTDDSINVDAEQWVGAWWLGFIACAVISLLIAIPISCFPRELPDTRRIREQRESQAHARADRSGKADREEFCRSWRDFPAAARIMFRNPTFLAVTGSATFENMMVTGVGSFLPIVLENQFGLSSGNANIAVGALVCVAGGGALFTGGWLVKRLSLKVPGMIRLMMIAKVLNACTLLTVFLKCPDLPLAGVYRGYSNSSALADVRLSDTCNEACQCLTSPYSPVCGSNDVMYFSPCFAGCQSSVDGVYQDCMCIAEHGDGMNETVGSTAVPGRCGQYCVQMYVFLACLFLIFVTTFIDSVPTTNTILRCVPDGQQSFALGIYGFIARLFGSLPGPIIFGSIVDATCTLWHEVDGVRGRCWFHSRRDLALYMIIFSVSLKGVAIVLLVAGYRLYTPVTGGKGEKATAEQLRA